MRGLAEPILVDEWQLAPTVLGAIKRTIDADSRPGRFIVTGSVHAALEQQTWPGTGRLIQLNMGTMTVREIDGHDLRQPPFVERLVYHGAAGLSLPERLPDVRDYLEIAVRGGFPEAMRRTELARRRWVSSYLGQLFTRDTAASNVGRDPARLRRYFEAYALNTAGVTAEKTLFESAGINRKTAEAYESLLRNVFVIDSVPAWSNNRLKRLVRSPKRYVSDSGLLAGALALNVEGLMRDSDLLGRVIDTFVTSQLRAELDLGEQQAQLYHLRDHSGGHEIDLIVELDVSTIVAIEIKASSAPNADTARHLRWLRNELGDRFAIGVVLHTGSKIFQLDERIIAAPICAIWG